MTLAPHVLVVDDDTNLTRLIGESLVAAGYKVTAVHAGLDALDALQAEHAPDIVILDVMLPRLDGWQILERIREISDVPVIFLTARDAESERLRGFDLGADDYVTKPFSLAELAARIRAVLARSGRVAGATQSNRHAAGGLSREQEDVRRGTLLAGDLTIDLAARRVQRAGRTVELTPTEYRLLVALARSAGRALSREEILVAVWGPEYEGDTDHVKRYVWYLRRKVEDDPATPRLIETVRGFGYRLASD